MNSKHIIGIGQQESGQAAIVHYPVMECDHQVLLTQECPQCVLEASGDLEAAHVAEMCS